MQHQEYLDDKIAKISDLSCSILNANATKVNEIADSMRGWEGTAGRWFLKP